MQAGNRQIALPIGLDRQMQSLQDKRCRLQK